MSPEDEKYYETYFDLFITDGWKQFVEEIGDILDSHYIEDIKDEKDLYYTQGERSSLLRITRFESGIKSAYESIKEAEDYASEI